MYNYFTVYKLQSTAKFREKWSRTNLLGKMGVFLEYFSSLIVLTLPLFAFNLEKQIDSYNQQLANSYLEIKQILNSQPLEEVLKDVTPEQKKILTENLSQSGHLALDDLSKIKKQLNAVPDLKENVKFQFRQNVLSISVSSIFVLVFMSFFTSFTDGLKTETNQFSNLLFTSSFSNRNNIFLLYFIPLISKAFNFCFFTFSFLLVCQYPVSFCIYFSLIIFLSHFLGVAFGLISHSLGLQFFLKRMSVYSTLLFANIFFIIFIVLIKQLKIAHYFNTNSFEIFYNHFNQFTYLLFISLIIITPCLIWLSSSIFSPYWCQIHEKPVNFVMKKEFDYQWNDSLFIVVFKSIWKSILRNPVQITQILVLPIVTFSIFFLGFLSSKDSFVLFIGLLFTFINIGFITPNLFYKIKEADVYFYLSSHNFKRVQNIQNFSLYLFPFFIILILNTIAIAFVGKQFLALFWFIPFLWKVVQIKNEIILNEKINLFIYHIKKPKNSKNFQADILMMICVALCFLTFQILSHYPLLTKIKEILSS